MAGTSETLDLVLVYTFTYYELKQTTQSVPNNSNVLYLCPLVTYLNRIQS